MKLSIKHLAPYLPYGLRDKAGHKITLSNIDDKIKSVNQSYGIGHLCLPVLRPLSDLTKEIKHNGEKFEEAEFFRMFYSGLPDNEIHLDGVSFKLERWQKLFEWHFDVFGLIEAGLAIDINTLKT